MVDENLAKGMGQRKRRLDRESSINLRNHFPAAVSSAKDRLHQQHHHSRRDSASRRDQTYTKRHREKLLQGSLENVSVNPLGDFGIHESTLRRSRSLAISREDVFNNLAIQHHNRNRRRSQLIPRAKLIDKYSLRDRSLQRGLSHESLYSDRTVIRRKTSACGDYAVPQPIQHYTRHRKPKEEDLIYASNTINNNNNNNNYRDIDSLESKSSLTNIYGVSQENLSYHPDVGLSLPNYYPDSKCDTDLSYTDCNISVNDTIKNSPIVSSCRGNSKLDSLYNQENISYDDNIVLSKNPSLYDKVSENNYYSKSKPRTIRGSTPYNHENDNYYCGKPRSLPNYTTAYDSDSTLSDYDPKYYEPVEKIDSNNNNNNNNHSNAKIDVDVVIEASEIQAHIHEAQNQISDVITSDNKKESSIYEPKSNFSNIEANPIYDEIPLVTDLSSPEQQQQKGELQKEISDPIKTSIQVQANDEDYVNREDSEEFKTVVSVPEDKTNSSNSSSKEGSPKEAKKHSHNYLKEFLETQKGSKKPLQNFLSKKISRAFAGDKNKPASKKSSNLVENQYYSLPDITVSKNLQKCEKIDRKLRKCDSKLVKSPSDTSTNRFIVNIGNHFDVTAHSTIPVDFELKISKIPKIKSKKHKNGSGGGEEREREKKFLDAVKNLNEALTTPEKPSSEEDNETKENARNNKFNKLIVNGEEIIYQRDKEVEVIIEDTKMNEENNNKEFQEKINTMRNYWGNIINDSKEKSDPIKEVTEQQQLQQHQQKDTTLKCKIVGVQTKVDEVKKKFEPQEERIERPNKVQLTKQFFEKKPRKPVTHGNENGRGLLENPYFENQFESLNSNTVEIIENSSTNTATENKHKPITKSRSITDEQEFDHVRYRVMKSDLFQKKIFAKCEKESQFDGLLQYLQDYSFQELLIDNNIVIIEPIRTNVQYVGGNKNKSSRNVTQFIHKPIKSQANDNAGLRKHFFYHPIRVNREVNDDELPNPDTVKQVRQIFESALPRSQSSKHLETFSKKTIQYRPVDPDKDRCSATDSNSSECGSNENFFESMENDVCCEYVSEDILEKIRQYGTSVTYYGGRVMNKRHGRPDTMTRAIMDEIKHQKHRSECSCRRNSAEARNKNVTFADRNSDYQGVKFKLLKSNSCSSRLELVGTKNLADYRNKFISKQKQLLDEHNLRKQNTNQQVKVNADKNSINEFIKHEQEQGVDNHNSPKIIGEEMKPPTKKLIQWGEMQKDEKTYAGITYTRAPPQKITYDYHHYDKVKPLAKKVDDMEFEPYEIAGN